MTVRKEKHFHDLKSGKHHSRYLQAAWNKYGAGAFVFQILEECDAADSVRREQFWIDVLNPDYNMTLTAGSLLGFKMSEESKSKLSAAQKGRKFTEEHRRNLSAAHKGRKFSKEICEQMSKSRTGRNTKLRQLTEEGRAKMLLCLSKGRQKPRSQEAKDKASALRKGVARPLMCGDNNPRRKAIASGKPDHMLGRRHSEETKLKMKASWLARRERKRLEVQKSA